MMMLMAVMMVTMAMKSGGPCDGEGEEAEIQGEGEEVCECG